MNQVKESYLNGSEGSENKTKKEKLKACYIRELGYEPSDECLEQILNLIRVQPHQIAGSKEPAFKCILHT